MRNNFVDVCSVVMAFMAGIAMLAIVPSNGSVAHAQSRPAAIKGESGANVHQSVLRIGANHQLPMTKTVTIARNKSMLVELPRELRDVLVSNPNMLDAVVQTSNRVYLIGKSVGQANAFFFDAQGQRVLTLEVQVELDTRPLDSLLRRFIPSSNIRTEVLNETLVLTGTVRNPADSSKAEKLASRFAVTLDPKSDLEAPSKVINMLVVEGRRAGDAQSQDR